MGFGDKFKDLTQQAKEKVAENRDKIQEVVDAASVAADERTHGKYAAKIIKVNQRTGSALDKFSTGAGEDSARDGAVDDAPETATGEVPGAATGEASGAATGAADAGPKFDDDL